ncbi:MAG: hypothetical protein ACLTG0_07455 [Oscillibacter sp.]
MLFERLQREGIDCRKLNFPRYGEKSSRARRAVPRRRVRYAPRAM